nr:hypothetical protein [Vibrio alginolyticus]
MVCSHHSLKIVQAIEVDKRVTYISKRIHWPKEFCGYKLIFASLELIK